MKIAFPLFVAIPSCFLGSTLLGNVDDGNGVEGILFSGKTVFPSAKTGLKENNDRITKSAIFDLQAITRLIH